MQSTSSVWKRSGLIFLTIVILTSCTGTKFLKEGETFYTGADIKFDTQGNRIGRKKAIEEELQTFINPKPNGTFLGNRPGVWFYFIAGEPKKPKGLKNFIKTKLGQPPVLLKDATPERTAKTLAGQLNNEGYFESTVTDSVITKRKESKVVYHVVLKRPYRLDTINYPQPKDSVYKAILKNVEEEAIIQPRQRYDLDRLKAEQERIEEVLENYGFYYFDDRYLIFEADTTVGKRKVNLDLKLEPGIPDRAKRIYSMNRINIYPNYSITDTLTQNLDTTVVDSFNYIDSKKNFRPGVLTRVINLRKGERYSREAHQLTLSHLLGLGVFKFVNVRFSEADKDSALLNADIFLTPLQKKSLRAEVEATSKSNNFVGPGISGTFTNRNFLRGAELFMLKLNSAYEVQISRQNNGPLNSFELGLESSLTFPRFISPIRIDYNARKYLPKTTVKVGINFQSRVNYYRLNSYNAAFGYIWRETASKSHEFYPIDINYVRTDKRSDDFVAILARFPTLKSSFEDQYIVGGRYSYTINTQLETDPAKKYDKTAVKTHNFYFNGAIDVAGNLLNLAQKTFIPQDSTYTLFNYPYSQFVKGSVDFRHYLQLDEHNKIASRIIIGAGYAYQNSETLPYIKQFSIGGSNSIRAFQARSIGPGTYDVREANKNPETGEPQTLFIDQRGDIKLEGNVEYRFDIYKSLKGALFVDAGNIWLWKEDAVNRPGGEFLRSEFMKQLAVGTGLGLRFDFSFFVLRFDTAFPLRKPTITDRSPWVINDVDFGSKNWRFDNLVYNIAIGYPF